MSNAPEWNQHKQDPASFLMGGSVPSASFLKIGDSVSGTISEPPTVQQQRDMTTNEPKVWENGDPMMQLVVTLQTDERDRKIEDDDGRRRIYVKFNMKKSVADAVRKAKAKELLVGGKLTVTYTHDGEVTRRGFSPPKFYSAVYSPPAAAFLDGEDHPDGPSRISVDLRVLADADGEVWTWDDAVTAVLEAGLVRDDFVAHVKASGIKKWSDPAFTPLAKKFIADRSGGAKAIVDDEAEIPF